MEKLDFGLLTKEEIEVRIGTNSDKGCSLLLYKTARVDANKLDEKVGAFNWQKKFYECNNTLFCSVGIYDNDKKEWVWKDDAGAETQVEKEKGTASDSFKRAGFAWGIGRELYSSPFIWVNKDICPDPKKERFEVESISYNADRTIKSVVIKNSKGVVVYPSTYKEISKPSYPPKLGTITIGQQKVIEAYFKSITEEQKGKVMAWTKNHFGVDDIMRLSEEQAKTFIDKLIKR